MRQDIEMEIALLGRAGRHSADWIEVDSMTTALLMTTTAARRLAVLMA